MTTGAATGELRVPSDALRAQLAVLERIVSDLATRPSQAGDVVVRPHPLIVLARRPALPHDQEKRRALLQRRRDLGLGRGHELPLELSPLLVQPLHP
jgi:hypothetical protein